MDSFIPRHEFMAMEIPVVTRLLSMTPAVILQHMRGGS